MESIQIKPITREEVEYILGFRIRNLEFYKQCLIHKSASKLYNVDYCNERIEFVGDSVLNMIVAKYLYDKYPSENEGFLTKVRTKIVNGKCLSEISKNMGLSNHIRMNNKALNNGWNSNSRILEDVLEALIGSIFLDLGYTKTYNFVIDLINKYINVSDLLQDNNYKDQLMRICQKKGYSLPQYQLIDETGQNYNKKFIIQVLINDKVFGEGVASNKKQAEQEGAENCLKCIGV